MQIVRSLVLSMRVRDVASSVGAFLGALLRSILDEAIRSLRSVRTMYIQEVAAVLCSSESKLRYNSFLMRVYGVLDIVNVQYLFDWLA
jgi:hypothetical protein